MIVIKNQAITKDHRLLISQIPCSSVSAPKWILNFKPGFINFAKDKVEKIISTLGGGEITKKSSETFSSDSFPFRQILAVVEKIIFQICRLWQKCTNISDCKLYWFAKEMQNMSAERHDNNSEVNQVKIFIHKWCSLTQIVKNNDDDDGHNATGQSTLEKWGIKKRTWKSEALNFFLEKWGMWEKNLERY